MPSLHSSCVVHIYQKINLFHVSTGANLFTFIMVQIGLLKKMLQKGLRKKETPESLLFSRKSLKTEVCLQKRYQFSSQICQLCLIHTKRSMRWLCPPSTSLLWGEKKNKNNKSVPHRRQQLLRKSNGFYPSPWYFPWDFHLHHRKIY